MNSKIKIKCNKEAPNIKHIMQSQYLQCTPVTGKKRFDRFKSSRLPAKFIFKWIFPSYFFNLVLVSSFSRVYRSRSLLLSVSVCSDATAFYMNMFFFLLREIKEKKTLFISFECNASPTLLANIGWIVRYDDGVHTKHAHTVDAFGTLRSRVWSPERFHKRQRLIFNRVTFGAYNSQT